MKFTVLTNQRGKDYVAQINVANRHVLDADSELYTELKEWFGRIIYEAHKRELARVVDSSGE